MNVLSLCLTLFGLLFSSFGFSQTETLQAILDKHTRVMGSLQHWQQLHSYQQTYLKDNGTQLIITCLMPDKITIHFKREGLDLTKAYDGEHGYILKNGEYLPMRPGEAIEMAEEPNYYSDLLFAASNNQTVSLLGKESVDGIECYKLQLEKSAHDLQIYWLNTQTYLIEQTGEYSEDPAHEGIYYKTRLLDYRNIKGYQFPFKQILIPSNRPAVTSQVSSTLVDINVQTSDFQYYPTTVKTLLAYWNDRYHNQTANTITFEQETIRYKDDLPADTTLWYEAINYPDRFRIDIGEKTVQNRNLYRNDSIYVLRSGEIVHSGPRLHESLLLEGVLYKQPTSKLMRQLAEVGIDTLAFCHAEYDGRPIYIIGANKPDTTMPQIWLDAERRQIVRRFGKGKNGEVLEVRYADFRQIDGYWIESWVEFYLDGKLLQTERYRNIKMNPPLPDAIFDPGSFKEHFWYE